MSVLNPQLGRFIQPDTVVPDAKNLQAYNRYTYVNNNPLKYVDPTGHFAWLAFGIAILVGALIGGATAAAFGGNIWVGMLTGAITGAVFFGAGQAIQAAGPALQAAGRGLAIAAKVSIHAAAGAVSGVVNNAIAGGGVDRLGKAALVGGISGGMGKLVGGFLDDERFFTQLFGRSMTGAAGGAFAASIMGGDPLTGAWQGAATAGAGSVFNDLWHDKVMPYLRKVFKQDQTGTVNNTRTKMFAQKSLERDREISAGLLQVTWGVLHVGEGTGLVLAGVGLPITVGIVATPVAGAAVFIVASPAYFYGG